MRNFVLTICSVFIMAGGFITAGTMLNPIFGLVTMVAGLLVFIFSFFKKPKLHMVITIISFILFLASQGSIIVIGLIEAGADFSNGYFNLTLFLFSIPFVFFVIALIAASKKLKKFKAQSVRA